MKPVYPIPQNAPELPRERKLPNKDADGHTLNWNKYVITDYYPYHDISGNISHYTARYYTSETDKEVLPFTLIDDNGKLKWVWKIKGHPNRKFLYNLHLLNQFQLAQVLIVEGEKCADVANKLFKDSGVQNDIIAVSWLGGVNGYEKADFSLLKNRNIILWPDNDLHVSEDTGDVLPQSLQPGYMAMISIASKLLSVNDKSKIKLMSPGYTERPAKWDIADAILIDHMSFDQIFEHIGNSIIDLPDDLQAIENEPEEQEEYQESIENFVPPEYTLAPFTCLGYNNNTSYFIPDRSQQIYEIPVDGLGNQSKLMWLAPLDYWEKNFQGRQGVSWKFATNTLINVVTKKGLFNMQKVRGRGGWIDNGRLVIHTGDKLLVDNQLHELHNFKSEFTYCKSFALESDNVEPLQNSESSKFLELCKMFSWERPIHAYLFAGWCVAAPVCGAITWRPHIWVTGEAGTGKSWILGNVVRKALGQWSIFVQSCTTEAAVRQLLYVDALATVFDEFESVDKETSQRIQKILELVRQSSFENGAVIAKGGMSGEAISYMIRSMFLFSSINVKMINQSDISRISVLPLKPKSAFTQAESKAMFAKIKEFSKANMTDMYYRGLRSRTFKLMNVINQNCEPFIDAATEILGTQRAGDQIGTLLAAAYSLSSSSIITREKALEWIQKQEWEDEKYSIDNSDSMQCLTTILQYVVKIDERHEQMTVAELIDKLKNGEIVNGFEIPGAQHYSNYLLRLGIKINQPLKRILISDTYLGIEKILKNTPYSNSWGRLLKRIPGASKHAGERFIPGVKTQATGIAFEMVGIEL